MADPVDNAPWYLQDPKDPGTVEPFMVAFRNLQENGRELEQYLQVEGRQFHSIDLCGFIKRASIESRRINHFLMTMSALPANERPPLPAALEELIHEFWDIDAIIGQGMERCLADHRGQMQWQLDFERQFGGRFRAWILAVHLVHRHVRNDE